MRIKKAMENKPKWITEEQWKAVPYVQWWADRKADAKYIKQSVPLTVQKLYKHLIQEEGLENL